MCCTLSYVELGETIIRKAKRPLTMVEISEMMEKMEREGDPKVLKLLKHLDNHYDQFEMRDFVQSMFWDADPDLKEGHTIIIGEDKEGLPIFYLRTWITKGKKVRELMDIMARSKRK